jgi:two-component system, response regulator PdtaR
MIPAVSRFGRTFEPKQVFSPADDRSESASEQKRRVLVVEDDFLVASEIEHTLQQAGYDIVGVANSAHEAIYLARAERPDVAIMDVRLAGDTDGVYAAIQIFQEFGIRSIFATAHADPDTISRGSRAKPFGWIQKPYGKDELLSALRAALN